MYSKKHSDWTLDNEDSIDEITNEFPWMVRNSLNQAFSRQVISHADCA